jgi:hypothetical protein
MSTNQRARVRRLEEQAAPGQRIVVVSRVADAEQITARPGEALLVIETGVSRNKEFGKW